MTPADRLYAQAADLFGADPDETADLDRDWHAARRSHGPNAWQRIRRPLHPRCRAVSPGGRRCQHRTPDGSHPGDHEHLDQDRNELYHWPNLTPGARRVSTPPRRNPKSGTTVVTLKRSCNRCDTELGDATETEAAFAMMGLPLPDVTGECPTCTLATGGAA
jgi:hypothetical protein